MNRIQQLLAMFTSLRTGEKEKDVSFVEFIAKVMAALDTNLEGSESRTGFEYSSFEISVSVDQGWKNENKFTLTIRAKEPWLYVQEIEEILNPLEDRELYDYEPDPGQKY